jgi:hypothetical protein
MIISKAAEMTIKYKISVTFEDKRKNISKKHFDKLEQDI